MDIHVYQEVWKPSTGETLVAKQEFDNLMDKHAVKVVLGNETVSHLPPVLLNSVVFSCT